MKHSDESESDSAIVALEEDVERLEGQIIDLRGRVRYLEKQLDHQRRYKRHRLRYDYLAGDGVWYPQHMDGDRAHMTGIARSARANPAFYRNVHLFIVLRKTKPKKVETP